MRKDISGLTSQEPPQLASDTMAEFPGVGREWFAVYTLATGSAPREMILVEFPFASGKSWHELPQCGGHLGVVVRLMRWSSAEGNPFAPMPKVESGTGPVLRE